MVRLTTQTTKIVDLYIVKDKKCKHISTTTKEWSFNLQGQQRHAYDYRNRNNLVKQRNQCVALSFYVTCLILYTKIRVIGPII
jgi:phosphate-selective porin